MFEVGNYYRHRAGDYVYKVLSVRGSEVKFEWTEDNRILSVTCDIPQHLEYLYTKVNEDGSPINRQQEAVMVRSGYYISRGVEYKIEGIEGNATDAWISGPGTPRQLYTYFASRIGDEHMGGLIKYQFVRPLEEQAESVYVYVAYCKGVRGNTFTYSHTGEYIFNEHLAQIERQGATVVAKKRIKFNIN